MIPADTVREIIEVAKVEEVVGAYVNLKRRGINLLGLCPFHNEKTPSFSVSPSKNIYKCFGCGRGGDSVRFLMDHEQFTYPEALRSLAERYNIEIVEKVKTKADVEREDLLNSIYSLMDYSNKYYVDQLLKSNEGRAIGLSYFKERGLIEKTIETFQLGFTSDQPGLVRQLKSMGFKEEILKKAGLVNKYGGDFFRDRVIFPIRNLSGKTIAFAGRIIGNKQGPKYVNSPETDIYVKNKVLYGMYLAKSEIRKKDRCFLVEGYTDVISLHQHGIKNVVASSGTSLTDNQIALIKRFTNNATILYDGDQAGINAAIRGVQMMLAADLNVNIALFPDGQDPDSFIQENGASKFDEFLVENEKDFVLFLASLKLKDSTGQPVQRAAVINEIIHVLSFVEDSIKRAAYVQELAGLAKIAEETILTALNKELRKRIWEDRKKSQKAQVQQIAKEDKAQQSSSVSQGDLSRSKSYYREKEIIRVLVNAGHLPLKKFENISVLEFVLGRMHDILDLENETFKTIVSEVSVLFAEGEVPETTFYLNHPNENIRKLAIDLSTTSYEYSENWKKKWDIRLQTQPDPIDNFLDDSLQTILRYKLDRINQLAEENLQEISSLTDEDEMTKQLEIQHEIIEMRKVVADELKTIVFG